MSNYLTHHGILGMKWGIRRFQNKDGTRTTAGKRREKAKADISSISDDDLRSKVNRLNLEKQYTDLRKENSRPSKMEKTKKTIDATSTLINEAKKINREATSPKKVKFDLSNMTEKEMRDRINRANLERQYNDLFGSEAVTVSKGQRYTSDILEVAGTTLAIGSSALGIALAIKELRR